MSKINSIAFAGTMCKIVLFQLSSKRIFGSKKVDSEVKIGRQKRNNATSAVIVLLHSDVN